MTFVRTRLLVERMAPGDEAEILLRGVEPVENVPASVAELGHAILHIGPAGDGDDGDMRLVIRRSA